MSNPTPFAAKSRRRRPGAGGARGAFTLIELLVIAVDALLVSILLPSLLRAQMLAKKAICGADLHSIHLSLAMCAEDSHFYPGARLGWTSYVGFTGDPPTSSNFSIIMTLPGLITPKYTDSFELFFCPAQSREHYFWKGLGHTGKPNDVGSKDWARNVNWKRLWWSSWGSCYGVPMSVGRARWRAGTYLTHNALWSYYGAVDLDSAGSNPESLYMADVDEYIDELYQQTVHQDWPFGIHLYRATMISELHGTPNYLTFGGQVVSDKTKAWLEATALQTKPTLPWAFEWSGQHAADPALTPPRPTWAW